MFRRDSAFGQQELALGQIRLPKPGEQKLGETRRTDTVEIPIQDLEEWNRALDDLVQADFDFRTSSREAMRLRISDVRDQIYRWLR